MPPKPEKTPGPIDVRPDGIIVQDGAYKGQRPQPRAAAAPRAAGGSAMPNPTRAPSGYRWAADGQSLEPIPGGPATAKSTTAPEVLGPKSEGEKKATVLFGSIYGAEKDVASLEGGTDTSSRGNAILGAIPLDADLAKGFQSQGYKKYQAAAKRWSANLLYMKSGATATPEEVESTYMQFFPQPGDGPEVKEQKKAARMDEMISITGTYPWLADKYDLGALRPKGEAAAPAASKSVNWADLP
jgi:hypothetical protein